MRSRRRVVAAVAGMSAIATGLGFVAGAQVVSPAERAARTAPPAASSITVPVERRVLESQVVTRGDTAFDGAIDLRVETADLETQPVVTGGIPGVGSTIKEGQVLLQVAGRPVLVLAGNIPTYRTLRPGLSGPDVTQLEQTLARLGLDPGTVDATYDQSTSGAVAELYERSGYEPPTPDATEQELAEAQASVAMAEASVAASEAALATAQAGPPEGELAAAQAQVNDAARALGQAQAGGDANEIAAAQDQLAVAQAALRDLQATPDTAEQEAMVAAAHAEHDIAQAALAQLEEDAAIPLPASEVVFIPTLPRRIDQVNVTQGQLIEGPVVRVSGAQLIVNARVGSADRQLVTEKMPVIIDHASVQLRGRVTAIKRDTGTGAAAGGTGDSDGGSAGDSGSGESDAGSGGSTGGDEGGGFTVVITPDSLSAEQIELLRDSNVKVTIPVSATDGEVLVVPLAALSAGPGGQSRVEVARDDGRAEVVPVQVGLSAAGYAEITPQDTPIEEGDPVIVGRSG